VVGHLEDVRAQRLAARKQVGLLGDLGVARQQHRAHRGAGPHHDGTVVHGGAVVRVDVRDRVRRTQDVEGEARPGQPAARGQRDQRCTGRRGEPGDVAQRPRGLADRAHRDRPDRPPPERAREAADVVGVQVAEQHEGDAVHSEAREAGVDRPVGRTGVDQHHPTRPGRCQHDGIALADVARHDHPSHRRPTRWDDPGRDDHDRRAREHGEQHSPASACAGHHRDATEHRDHEQRPHRARGPGQGGTGHRSGAVGHGDEPRGGPPGEPGTGARGCGCDRGHQRGQYTQHRGGSDGGRREQVRDHGYRADQPAQPGHDRGGDEEGRGGYGERLGGQPWYSARGHPCRPPGGQEHERGRGRDRQREPGVDGERGIGEQQHQHGGGERGQRRARTARPERHQGDRSHHGRPDHAGRRPGEHHEAHQDRGRRRGRQPRIGPEPSKAREHGAGQDREIRPGDREEVGEPGGAEVVVNLLGEGAGVADGQAGQQPGLGGRQRAGGDPQARAQAACRRLPPRRVCDVVRDIPHPQHRDGEIVAIRRGEQTLGRDGLAWQQPLPALSGREQQHPAPTAPAPRAGGGRHHVGGHDDPRRGGPRLARGAQRPRIVAQHDPQGGRRAPERLLVQWMRGDQEGVGRDDDPGRGRRARRGEQDRRAMPTAGERGGDARDQPARDRPEPQPEQHHRPGGGRGRDQPEVDGRVLGGRAHQTVTRSRSCWNRRSPMPSISRS
jgi:hypothetical protein